MTREEYQRKYGTLPQTQPQAQPQAQPIQMTREQYRQRYGVSPGQQVAPPNVGEFVTGMVKNIPKSGVNLVKDMWSGVTSLPSTIGSVASGETKLGDIARGVGQSFKQRYLDKGALKNTLYNDPLGLAADASMVLGGGAAAVKAGSTAARVAGATKAASNLSKAGRALTTASRATDPILAVGKAGKGLISKGVRNLDDYGRGYATAGIGNPAQISKADDILAGIKTQAIDPVTGKSVTKPMNTAEFISQNNLYSRSPDELAKYGKTLMKQFDTIADNKNLQVKVADVVKPMDDLIEATKQAVKDFPGEKAYKTQLKELIRQRSSIVRKGSNGIIPGDVALRLRRILDAVSSRSASMGVMQKPGELLARQTLVSGLRSGLRSADPRLKAIGKQLQAIGFDAPGKEGPLLKAFKGFESRGQARNPITLTNVTSTGLSSGVGALLGGAPGAVVAPMAYSLFNRAVTSPGGIKATSQAAKGTAQAIGTATRKASPIMSFGTRSVGQPARIIKKGQEMPPTNQEKRQPKGLQSYNPIIPQNLFSRYVEEAKNPESEVYKLNKELYDPQNIAGLVGSVKTSSFRVINPQDRKIMTEFIDAVRLSKPSQQLQLDASRIAERYGLKMPKSLAGIANVFDDVLATIHQKFPTMNHTGESYQDLFRSRKP
jgi:hypothetical protein